MVRAPSRLIIRTVRTGAPSGPPYVASARACVDSPTRQAWLMRDGNVIYGNVIYGSSPGGERQSEHTDRPRHRPRSHGCVHLAHRAAQTFDNTLHVGDLVQVIR